MNTAKVIIILVGVGAIGYLGYSFYTSSDDRNNQEFAYEISSNDPYEEIDNFDEEDILLESDLNYLEGMDFDGSEENTLETEQAFESQISAEEQQESSFDTELDDLEAQTF